ncbi:MAG: tyrosine-type recombinase/integrase [Defluviitaleaceae bacterium]|nr:tyrosine-type recombinase/integrase [Defluviitaleaceae bacterium]
MKELARFKNSQQLIYWKVTGKNAQPNYIFTNMKNIMQQKGNEWYTKQNYRNVWKGISEKNKIPYFVGSTLHSFRHTHATIQLLKSQQSYEVKFKIVSKRLGHADVFETLRTYHHLFPEQQSSFDDEFNSYMDELAKPKISVL